MTQQNFVITAEWLARNATARGGYSRRQLELVGVSWPPRPGWKIRVVGAELSAAEKAEFEGIAAASRGVRGR